MPSPSYAKKSGAWIICGSAAAPAPSVIDVAAMGCCSADSSEIFVVGAADGAEDCATDCVDACVANGAEDCSDDCVSDVVDACAADVVDVSAADGVDACASDDVTVLAIAAAPEVRRVSGL